MNKKTLDFCQRLALKNAPAFLFLGQGYLKIGTDKDIFLETIFSKFRKPDIQEQPKSYKKIFTTCIMQDADSARAWISERAQRLITPVWLEQIARFNWSGVYTSAFNGLLNQSFRNDWRSVQPLFSPHLQPLDPRSRSKLHISYLFGSIEQEDLSHRSPLNSIDLIRRNPQATVLLHRLPEQLTPLGTLAIDGYLCNDDWLSPENLLPVLMELQKDQVYLFSATEEHFENEFIQHAIDTGRLEIFRESLASVLSQGVEAGIIPVGHQFDQEQRGRRISRGNDEIQVPNHVWTQLSRYATLLDDALYLPPTPLSSEKRYSGFRAFLAESGSQPIWSAYTYGFAFNRDYEFELRLRVNTLLNSTTFEADPIVVHGQTGAGKTIALGSLAFNIRAEKRHSVLFIGRRNQRINYNDIDQFCQWSEGENFPATLIIWDGMQDLEQYYLLHKHLIGRGRNFVLVGSAYKLEDQQRANNLIIAPGELSPSEIPRFKTFLSSFASPLGSSLDSLLREEDSSFLVALYRLLPETRSQVRQGLNLEAGITQILMREKSQNINPEVRQTVLAQALLKAGMLNKIGILTTDKSIVAGETISSEQELIGLIMVPGRFGLQVPIEVLLRSVQAATITNFHEIFFGIDLFRWSEDNFSNILVGARHALEAKLIAQSRLGGPQTEIEYAKKLLRNIRLGSGQTETAELQFAADFVRCLGPNGPEHRLYSHQYLELANELTKIREEHGVKTPRLMLQEASLLREVLIQNLVDESEVETRLELLSRAEIVLMEAIHEVGTTPKSARLKSMLLVELASTYGTRAREYLRNERPTSEILEEFTKARTSAMKARVIQPEDFFPIDVIAWSTKDLLTHGQLDESTKMDIIVNLFNTLALCEGDEISVRDKEKLQRRRYEFSILLDDEVLKEDALKTLTEMGSPAGHYLTAVNRAGQLPIADGIVSPQQLASYKSAVEYLKANYEAIKSDGRCIYLYLRYWWTYNSRLPFYPSERTPLPFDKEQWREALQILELLLSLDEEFSNPQLRYLEAISRWHLGYYDAATEVWRELQRISDRVTGRKRVMKTYLASMPNGEPRKFHGIVSSISEDGSRGEIFVEGLLQRIAFFPRDFGLEDIQRDEQVSGFHIAFNYIAPTADPAHHYAATLKKVQ